MRNLSDSSPKSFLTAAKSQLPLRSKRSSSEQPQVASLAFTAWSAATSTFAGFYLLSGLVGVWAAYDKSAAYATFFQMVLGVAPIFLLPIFASGVKPLHAARVSVAIAILAAYAVALMVVVDKVMATAQGPLPETIVLSLRRIDLVANLAVMLIPPIVAATVYSFRERNWLQALIALGALSSGVTVMYLSQSTGAWIGLSAGLGLAIYLYWRFERQRVTLLLRLLDAALLTGIVLALIGYVTLVFVPPLRELAAFPVLGEALASRVAHWRDALPLVEDYLYTGAGLGVLPLVLSTYAFLVHVPFLYDLHNIYLQVVLEQGIVGLVGFLGTIVGALAVALASWRKPERSIRILLAGWVAAVIAFAVHGLLESELQASALRVAPLLAVSALYYMAWLNAHKQAAQVSRSHPARWLGVGVAILFLLLPMAAQPHKASWQANMGAVLETKSLLAHYKTGDWMIQDVILRERGDLFDEAERHLQRAIEVAPENGTANRRLGQIAMARGEYEAAFDYFTAALASPLASRLTLQYLGELYALGGDPQTAAHFWGVTGNAQGQLNEREWWYRYILDDDAQFSRIASALRTYKFNMDSRTVAQP